MRLKLQDEPCTLDTLTLTGAGRETIQISQAIFLFHPSS